MNRSGLIRLALASALVLLALAAAGQNALEIITLKHRTADQVLPALRPLLEAGATLSGQGNQLIVRASAANLDDLRLALEALDRPARRLLISVRVEGSHEAASTRIEASGSAGSRGSRFDLRAEQAQAHAGERVDQRVQVLDGSRAVIYSGRSRPVRQRIHTPGGVIPQQMTIAHDEATGFEVVPHLTGRGVQIEILGQAGTQQASTSVAAALGQWVQLGRASAATTYRSELQDVWLKVEELSP